MRYLTLLLFSVTAFAQQNNFNQIPDCSLGYCAGNGAPTFACFAGQKYARVDTPGNNYTCTGTPSHWVADAGNGGNILSVFGRTGAVTSANGDYTASQVTNAADVTANQTFTGANVFKNASGLTIDPTSGTNIAELFWAGTAYTTLVQIGSTGIALGMGFNTGNQPFVSFQTANQPEIVSSLITTNGATAYSGTRILETASANFLDPANTVESQEGAAVTTGGNAPITLAVGDNTTVVKNTNIKLQGASSVNGQLICVADGTNCPSTGGGVAYPSATATHLPAATITGGVTSLVDTAFSDDTTNTHDSEPFYLVGEYQQAIGTANSSNNYVSNVTNWLVSYWNGSAPVTASWNVYAWVAQGASPPATVLTYYSPAGLPVPAVLYALDPGFLATSGINYNSPKFKTRGNCWNGSTATLDDWNWQGVVGTGANPTETLQFTHVGCSGLAAVEMPGLKLDGNPQIESAVSTNSDISGEFTLAAATTAGPYTWQNTYASHPECVLENQFSSAVAKWVTYSGTTSFTINYASAVTGTVSYVCIGRN